MAWDCGRYRHALGLILATLAFGLVNNQSAVYAQVPELLGDLNPVSDPIITGSTSNILLPASSVVLFVGKTREHGRELWRTDGSEAGTFLIADFTPGIADSEIQDFTLNQTNNGAFFIARTSNQGQALLFSDGNSLSTVYINPNATEPFHGVLSILGLFNGSLLLRVNDPTIGSELWISNGTQGGTVLLKDINPGLGSSTPIRIGTLGSSFLFSADNGTNGAELWKTNGTLAGTVMVKDFFPGATGSLPRAVSVLGSKFLLSARRSIAEGEELVVTDGSDPGTILVADINPGNQSSAVVFLGLLSGNVFFAATGPNGRELYKSNGTVGNAIEVANIDGATTNSNPQSGAVVAGNLFFTAEHPSFGRELWKSNGTGASLVKDIEPGPLGSEPTSLTPFFTSVFFEAETTANGKELWKSSGAEENTQIFLDLVNGSGNSNAKIFSDFSSALHFVAIDDTLDPSLFKVNFPGDSLTKLFSVADNAITAGSFPEIFVKLGEKVCFDGSRADAGAVFTCSTNGSLEIVREKFRFLGGLSPSFLGGRAIISAEDSTTAFGAELYLFDPSANSLSLLKDIAPGTGNSFPQEFVELNGRVFFSATSSQQNFELFITDGTPQGTNLVRDLNPTGSGAFGPFILLQDKIIFPGQTVASNVELFVSDGTFAGTSLLKEIDPDPSSGSFPDEFVEVNGKIFFFANDGSNGEELWETDGTPTGTLLVGDLKSGGSGALDPFNSKVVTLNNAIYFSGRLGDSNDEFLVRSDGTAAGTTFVKTEGFSPFFGASQLTVAGSNLFFISADLNDEVGLYRSDGSEAGTALVRAFPENTLFSSPENLIQADGLLYFTFLLENLDVQLWRSDGTAEGTFVVGTFANNNNLFISPAQDFATLGAELYLSGFRSDVGQEPFAILDSCPGDTSKFKPGVCGCGVAEVDLNVNAIFDCQRSPEFKFRVEALRKLVKKVKPKLSAKKLKALKKSVRAAISEMQSFGSQFAAEITVLQGINLTKLRGDAAKKSNKALKLDPAARKAALKALGKLLKNIL